MNSQRVIKSTKFHLHTEIEIQQDFLNACCKNSLQSSEGGFGFSWAFYLNCRLLNAESNDLKDGDDR
ncbi:hypothetical protein T07_9346 [Trichinella nelsoni]|uniref:Uncharacterized protein n=1 Tax=Trichinella nelsoni TaxID=6336 RepID=A0A0V0SN81_9BILA|nr:hypothetical protein T07_9346 [Trichinella nelsoni]